MVVEMRKKLTVKLVKIICIIGILIVCISQFTNLYYYIDDRNVYHSQPAYALSVLIPFAGMLIDMAIIIKNRRKPDSKIFYSMLSYIVLPVIMAVIQITFFGFSLINLSICISILFMYIAMVNEQNRYIATLAMDNSENLEKLEISTTLRSISIGAGVTTIGAKAFEGCKKLEQITVKTTKLKNVTKKAFAGLKQKIKIKGREKARLQLKKIQFV